MSEAGPFGIDENSRRVGKFASGLVTSVVINFKPEDEEDYYHKLIVDVNGTRIAIPVIGKPLLLPFTIHPITSPVQLSLPQDLGLAEYWISRTK